MKTILTTVIASAIVGNVVFLFNVNDRLARMETQIKFLVDTRNNLAHK